MFDELLSKTATHFTLTRESGRKIERLQCDRSLVGSLILANEKPVEVWIRDLSVAGIGIITAKPIRIDQDAVIGLRRSKTVAANAFPARVIYCTAESERCWHVGLLFQQPLDEAIVQYLVG